MRTPQQLPRGVKRSREEHVECDEGQRSLNVAILEVGAPNGRVNTRKNPHITKSVGGSEL